MMMMDLTMVACLVAWLVACLVAWLVACLVAGPSHRVAPMKL